MDTLYHHSGNGMPMSMRNGHIMPVIKAWSVLFLPVVKEYKNLFDVANLLLQKAPAPNFTATMKLTFKPVEKYKGERTGLVVMGMDYAGLILENTDKVWYSHKYPA